MSTSLVYRSAVGYELLMRVLYGRHYADRMRGVAAEVPAGSSVLELCCGPGTLYVRYLQGRVSRYVGLDVNPGFVKRLRDRGVDARLTDLRSSDPLPAADVALMQASLYQFLPDARQVLDRMVAAARHLVVVSEPVRNLASSANPLLRLIASRSANPGVAEAPRRYDEQTLDELFERYRELVLKAQLLPGGREKLYVLRTE